MIIDKFENLRLENELRIIFNYFKVCEDLLRIYIKLSSKVYDYLLNSSYKCLFKIDFKYIYLTVPLHPDDYQYFAFIILGIE